MNLQAELALHTLMCVSRMAAEGDYETPHRLGLRNDQIEKILALSAQEIHEMAATTKAAYMQIRFDSDALDAAMMLCGRRIRQRELILQLLTAGASLPVMRALFGLTSTDTAGYRKYLNLPKADGRPSIPSEDEQARIWEHWRETEQASLSIAERLLYVHQQTQIKISAIWPLIQEWFAGCLEGAYNGGPN
ncbi:DUF2857 domain-containing protein [Methylomicrobium sp. wino1]|uniref:DUF2857 domain-containing protein n=1 Tax=Methylotuvimicrobium sp. TaxID=2822413 RepID=UPI000F654C81